jgi:glutaredoxin
MNQTTAIFYHAGCPVCLSAEQRIAEALDPSRYRVEHVHLGEQPQRIDEAARAGIVSVPALLIDGLAFHINHGAALADLR